MKKGMTHLKMRVLPPSIYSCWVNILGNIDLGENSYYWLYLASLEIGVLIEKGISFPAQIVDSYKHLAISAILTLEPSN